MALERERNTGSKNPAVSTAGFVSVDCCYCRECRKDCGEDILLVGDGVGRGEGDCDVDEGRERFWRRWKDVMSNVAHTYFFLPFACTFFSLQL